MGGGPKPKPDRRHEGGSSGEEKLTGFAAIEQFGEGLKDPVTGQYSSYNIPPGHAARRPKDDDREGVRWTEIVEQRQLLVADFRSEYNGMDLDAEWPSMSWALFEDLVSGLMQANTRLGRFFAPAPTRK